MFSPRYLLVPALLALCAAGAQGQPRKDDALDFRRLLTPPKTTPEFWEALVFELEVGRPDLAAAHLRTLVSRKPTPDELVELHRKEGIAAFLRLRLVPKWSEDRTREKQARDDVESLIDMITQAVRANLTNPIRIRTFVNNLYGLPEENAFARIELTKSGAAAVPYLIDEMLRRPEADRLPIVEVLSVMGHDAMQPLLAALDINNNVLREN